MMKHVLKVGVSDYKKEVYDANGALLSCNIYPLYLIRNEMRSLVNFVDEIEKKKISEALRLTYSKIRNREFEFNYFEKTKKIAASENYDNDLENHESLIFLE